MPKQKSRFECWLFDNNSLNTVIIFLNGFLLAKAVPALGSPQYLNKQVTKQVTKLILIELV